MERRWNFVIRRNFVAQKVRQNGNDMADMVVAGWNTQFRQFRGSAHRLHK
jgi:hypothetical protein